MFARRADLTKHMRVHDRELIHVCSFCSKGFSDKSNLISHERIHKGEKPYICTQCGYATADQGNLTVHMRTHSEERPYVCEECGGRCDKQPAFSTPKPVSPVADAKILGFGFRRAFFST